VVDSTRSRRLDPRSSVTAVALVESMHLLPYYTVFLFFYLSSGKVIEHAGVSPDGHTSLIFGLIGNLGVVGTNQLYHADSWNDRARRTQVNLIRDGFAIMSVVSFYPLSTGGRGVHDRSRESGGRSAAVSR